MAKELTVQNKQFIATSSKEKIADIIKPLTKEIYLFDTFVSATSRIKNQEIFNDIKVGDKLLLRREESKFDENEVVILTKDKEKIGYIPEKDNVIFARLMDAGKMLDAKIISIERKGPFIQIYIGIYLIDF